MPVIFAHAVLRTHLLIDTMAALSAATSVFAGKGVVAAPAVRKAEKVSVVVKADMSKKVRDRRLPRSR